jgi:demethylmenaquinone methyltransferase/2-methoxy-6-polyprenyl-1,4-benzoquinol methylase
VGGLALGGRSWWDVGRFLGPNIEGFYTRWPLPRIVGAWKAAGMVDVGWRVMSLGGGLVMWGTKGDA